MGKGLLLVVMLMLGGCASTQGLRGFSSDGCSLYPEGDATDPQRWAACCMAHDQAYWRGGTADERQTADAALRSCVLARTGREGLARRMYLGVRVGGSAWLPTGFRWGYGWSYGRGYAPLDAQEQAQADALLAAYRQAQPDHFCGPALR